MSRYVKEFEKYTYMYGFDPPLSEYFFSKFLNQVTDEDLEDEAEFSVSNNYPIKPHIMGKRRYSNGDILELILKEETELGHTIVDQAHKESIIMDIPF
jgi:hypothetical protein